MDQLAGLRDLDGMLIKSGGRKMRLACEEFV
jgi:hypothetical protein